MHIHFALTPLCPAGHLPLKGGDYASIDVRHQSQALQNGGRGKCQPISPLEGEMPGRAEGGVDDRHFLLNTEGNRP
ncbi:hypothetical protein C7477_12034 [Phyllobacterium leguminum]|uniref:Lytic murein transglycosylase n=1 Tax=Phyllobacterium leguminum TaxID=314237 RepID=A0A318SXQ1_9HYPH|nr:hypothetical protein C7477_12034 [Phyllobacterium leguminum]